MPGCATPCSGVLAEPAKRAMLALLSCDCLPAAAGPDGIALRSSRPVRWHPPNAASLEAEESCRRRAHVAAVPPRGKDLGTAARECPPGLDGRTPRGWAGRPARSGPNLPELTDGVSRGRVPAVPLRSGNESTCGRPGRAGAMLPSLAARRGLTVTNWAGYAGMADLPVDAVGRSHRRRFAAADDSRSRGRRGRPTGFANRSAQRGAGGPQHPRCPTAARLGCDDVTTQPGRTQRRRTITTTGGQR